MSSLSRRLIKRILIIKLRGIGDVILSTVVLDSLIETYPDAVIDYLTETPSVPVLQGHRYLNSVIPFNKSIGGMITAVRLIRKKKYDLVLDFYSNPRTAQLTFLSGAANRAGFPYRGRQYAYNLKGPEQRDNVHSAELHLMFLEKIGIPVVSGKLNVALPEKDILFARTTIESSPLLGVNRVAISPSGGWASKKADAEVFVNIAEEIQKKFSCKFLIVWGPGDKEDAEKIAAKLGSAAYLAPASSFTQMGAMMTMCKAVIANDSGPMHYAAALGVPVLALFGPTAPGLQGPYGKFNETVRYDELDCIGCNLLNCPKNHECFRELPVQKVLQAFFKLTQKNNIELI